MEISGGDFVIDESTGQHQRRLLVDNKGDYKEHPLSCVGVFNYIDDEGPVLLMQVIAEEFAADGMRVDSVQAVAGKIETEANY